MEDYKEKTMKSYARFAEEHSKKFKNLMEFLEKKEFADFLALLKGKKILDLGCGAGDHSRYFMSKGLDVSAIDLSPAMVKLSQSKGVNAKEMDIEALDFKDNTFDGIWAVTSLLHIPKEKIPKIIEKLHTILRKEGVLYVCVLEGEGERMKKDKQGDEERFFAFWQEEELEQLFNKQFKTLNFERISFRDKVFLEFFFRKN